MHVMQSVHRLLKAYRSLKAAYKAATISSKAFEPSAQVLKDFIADPMHAAVSSVSAVKSCGLFESCSQTVIRQSQIA